MGFFFSLSIIFLPIESALCNGSSGCMNHAQHIRVHAHQSSLSVRQEHIVEKKLKIVLPSSFFFVDAKCFSVYMKVLLMGPIDHRRQEQEQDTGK